MLKLSSWRLAAVALFGALLVSGCADLSPRQAPKADIGFVKVDADITLREMVVHNPKPKGTVLLLHGFPETLYSWKDIALALGDDYEVHAIDWPGYGQSSRPAPDKFSYAPRDFARVLKDYIRKSGIDTSHLTIYAADVGGLPPLLMALEEPDIAKTIIVGDFAPFNRPAYMHEKLQNLKSPETAPAARIKYNLSRDDVLQNAYRRGFSKEEQFDISPELNDDMARGWGQGGRTAADALADYYAYFSRDEEYFESNLGRFKTPVKVVWGERDIYINKAMGIELAEKLHAPLTILPGIGHYPHLQNPKQTIEEIRASFR